MSADICEKCMDAFRDRVKDVYQPSVKGKFICDMSGEVISTSTFKYYKCNITKVAVTLSGQHYECSKCGSILKDENDNCNKCAEGVGIRHADMEIDDEYLFLNVSESMYDRFSEHIANIKNLENDNG
jgi:ribosomal protein S27AE